MSSAVEAAVDLRPFLVDVPEDVSSGPRRRGVSPRVYQAPRSWIAQAYPNLIYLNEVDEGNHFAAREEPKLFTNELRAFRSLRNGRSS